MVGAGVDLEARAEQLRKQMNAPAELARVEAEIAAQAFAELKAAAEKRLVGIQRAMGSLAAASEQDDLRVLQIAQQYQKAMAQLNDRFDKLMLLHHEAKALVEGFQLEMPTLPAILRPAARPAVDEARIAVVHVALSEHGYIPEQREHDVKTQTYGRRTYRELDTEVTAEGHRLLKCLAAWKQPVAA
jgi:hypothetical protein